MNNQPIGILDSGVGGLSILREITKKLPNESIIYVADSKNCPYGTKTKEEIYKLARRLVEFLVKKDCKLIVVACNTITVSCIDSLRIDFLGLPIIGTVPVIKTACEKTKNKKVGILSTSKTAESQYQKYLIQKFAGDCDVLNLGNDNIVPMIEKRTARRKIIRLLRHEFQPFIEKGIDTLVLGCSHFPLIADLITEIIGNEVEILDSGGAIARQVERILRAENLLSGSKISKQMFYTTGNKENFGIIAESLFWKIGCEFNSRD